jgi:aldehyde dehydrogenase (NAD+)
VLATRRFGSRGRPLWLQGASFEVQRLPFGIVLVIAPVNYPLFLSGVQALHALVAGNLVLLKPAPGTLGVAMTLAEIARAAGLESGLLNVLPESIEAAHRAIAHGVDKVIFTGSSENGREILSELAGSNTPAVMELSGEDPVLVLADADVPMVVRALLFGIRWNGGATCMAPHKVIAVGPLASEVRAGICRAGVIDLPVEEVASEEAALHRLAAHRFALGVSIFSRDIPRARLLAGQISSGFVVINDLIVPTADPRMPFGGVKASGFGVTRGEEGLLEMTFPHVIAVRHNQFRPHFDELRAEDARLFSSYIRAAHSRGLKRVKAIRDLISALLTRTRSQERSP